MFFLSLFLLLALGQDLGQQLRQWLEGPVVAPLRQVEVVVHVVVADGAVGQDEAGVHADLLRALAHRGREGLLGEGVDALVALAEGVGGLAAGEKALEKKCIK